MKTAVTATSIAAYRETVSQRMTLKQRVAEYILSETRQGRPVWIGKIASALRLEKSTASARLNEIKKDGVELHGVRYVIEYVKTGRPYGEAKSVEQWALVLPRPEVGEQAKLF